MSIRKETIIVTPATATEWMSKTAKQRPLDKATGEKWKRDIAGGNYVSDVPDPIMFDEDGHLRNGQHRLYGVKASGVQVQFEVWFDVPEEVIRVIDKGQTRSFVQQLAIDNRPNAKLLAPTARRLWLWDNDIRYTVGAKKPPSESELLKYIDLHPEVESQVDHVNDLWSNRKKRIAGVQVSEYAVCSILLSRIDEHQCEDFFNALQSGAGLQEDSVILTLRDTLRDPNRKVRLGPNERIYLIFKAWNHWRQGESRVFLRMPPGGLRNQNFEIPK